MQVSGNNVIRLYTATDACNNASTFEQILRLHTCIPNKEPYLVLPSGIQLYQYNGKYKKFARTK